MLYYIVREIKGSLLWGLITNASHSKTWTAGKPRNEWSAFATLPGRDWTIWPLRSAKSYSG